MLPLRDSQPSGTFPLITILIILGCSYVLFLQATAQNPETFIRTWALIPNKINFLAPDTLFPFFTSLFMHGGLMHFVSNMWYLWIFGDNVEGALGKIGFAFFYIAAGIGASFAQFFLVFDSSIPNLGASGAIAGVLGFYLVNFKKSSIETLVPYPFPTIVVLPAPFILSTWFILQVLSGAISLSSSAEGGVAWWAHIGGFIFGYMIGMVFKNSKRSKLKAYDFE